MAWRIFRCRDAHAIEVDAMAQDDDRSLPQYRGPPPGASSPPDHVSNPQVYEIFHGSKPEDRDGTVSMTPSEEQQPGRRPTITDGLKTIKSEDFFKVHQLPCARQGWMTGIGAGFVFGVGRYITGGQLRTSRRGASYC
jgi:cytochrome c oxidase assembly protein subunit 20